MTGLTKPLHMLHITDLHCGGAADERERWNEFAIFAKQHVDDPLDLLLVTGDLADKHAIEGYTAACDVMQGLMIALRHEAGPTAYVVPGNHDIDRQIGTFLGLTPSNLPTALDSPTTREIAERPLARFSECVRAAHVCGPESTERVTRTSRDDARVLLLNSAWLARDSDNDQGKMSVAAQRWRDVLGPPHPDDGAFTVALMHHAPSWLTLSERAATERFLLRHADLVLCGHEHREDVRRIIKDGYQYVLSTGASVGAAPHLHHRAFYITALPSGEVRFRRWFWDPDNEAWAAATHELQELVTRAASRKTRYVLPEGTDWYAHLRAQWVKRFEKDILAGYEETESRDLQIVFRKLSLARLAREGDNAAGGSLWARLSQALRPPIVAQIAQAVGKRLATFAVEAAYDWLQKPKTELWLKGELSEDIDVAVDRLVDDYLLEDGMRSLRSKYNAEVVLRSFPSYVRSEVELACGDFSSPEPRFAAQHLWLVIHLSEEAKDQDEAVASEAASLLSRLSDAVGADRDELLTGLLRGFVTKTDLLRLLAQAPKDKLRAKIVRTLAAQSIDRDLRLRLGSDDPRDALAELADWELWRVALAVYGTARVGGLLVDPARLRSLATDTVLSASTLGICTMLLASQARGGAGSELAWTVLSASSGTENPGELIQAVLPDSVRRHLAARASTMEKLLAAQEVGIQIEQVKAKLEALIRQSYQRVLLESIDAPSLSFEEVRTTSRCIAVLGGPGSGKTTMLRHLCVTCGDDEVPVMVPLRNWQRASSLLSCVEGAITDVGLTCTLDDLAVKAKESSRRLLLLLDGLDEVASASPSHRAELEKLIAEYPDAQVVLTSRHSTAKWLPDVSEAPRYSLNRFGPSDVKAYIATWFQAKPAELAKVWAMVEADSLTADSLRTPFVLRMFCAIVGSDGATDGTWGKRISIYKRIATYLLHERDAARGITLKWSLEQKMQTLSILGRACFEEGLATLSYDQLLTAARASVASEDAEEFIKETVKRSEVLVKVNPATGFDFSHFTLREYFAVEGWSSDEAWRTWTVQEDQRYLTQESIPRFIVGRGADPAPILARMGNVLKGNPARGLLLAGVRAEVFDRYSEQEQTAVARSFLDEVADSSFLTGDEVGAAFLQMVHRARRVRTLNAVVLRALRETVGREQEGRKVTNLLAIALRLRDPTVSDALCQTLAVCQSNALRTLLRRTLALQGPQLAGAAVADTIFENGELPLLRHVLLASDGWVEHLRGRLVREMEREKERPQGMFDLSGLVASEDILQALPEAVQGLLKGISEGRSHGLEPEVGESFMMAFTARSIEKRALRLAQYPSVVEYLASILGPLEIGQESNTKGFVLTTDDLVKMLTDAAWPTAVGILVTLPSERTAEARRLMCLRYEQSLPADPVELCSQIVDDLWVTASSDASGGDMVKKAKGERVQYARNSLSVPVELWNAVQRIAQDLERRPEPNDWVFLQHRFGGLLSFLARTRSRSGPQGDFNIVGDADYEVLAREARVQKDIGP